MLKINMRFGIFLSGLLFVTLLGSKVSAKEVQVPSNKTWKVTFNNEIQLDELTKNDIIVLNKKGETVPLSINYGKNKKELLITPNGSSYKDGESYVLSFGEKVHDANNKKMKSKYSMNFFINNSDVSEDYLKDLIDNADWCIERLMANDTIKKDGITAEVIGRQAEDGMQYSYGKLNSDYSSKDKVQAYLNNIFSSRKSNEILKTKAFTEVNGEYYVMLGNLGYGKDIKNAKMNIIDRDGNKIYLNMKYNTEYDKNSLKEANITLIYENGKWVIDEYDTPWK